MGSFFDRAGTALGRIGKDVYQSQVQYTNEQKEQRMPNKGNPDFKYTFAGVNHAGNIVYDEVDLRKKIGFIEGIDYGMQDGQYIPFAGGFIKGHTDNRYKDIKDKIKNGEQINQKDYEFFNRRYEREREKTLRGFTVAGNIGQYLPNSLAFMAELAVSQLSIAKVGMAEKAAKISKGVTDFIAGANVVQKMGKLGAMGANTAGFIMGRGLAAMGTAALAEALPSGWGRIYATYHERRLNDEIKITDRGTLIFTEAKETPAKAFFKSLQSVYISYLSEGMGELIGAGVIKPAGYIAGKIVVNPLTKKIASEGEKQFAYIMENSPALSNMIKKTTRTLSKAYEKLNNLPIRGKNVDWLKNMTKFDGFLEELGEEVLEDILNLTFKTNDEERTLENYIKAIKKTPDEWAILTGTIALQGGFISLTGNLLGNAMQKNGADSREILKVLNSSTENEQRDLINELVKWGDISPNDELIQDTTSRLKEIYVKSGVDEKKADKAAQIQTVLAAVAAEKANISTSDVLGESLAKIEQIDEKRYVDENGIMYGGVEYNESESVNEARSIIKDYLNKKQKEYDELPDNYDNEDDVNNRMFEITQLTSIMEDEELSEEEIANLNTLAQNYEQTGQKDIADAVFNILNNGKARGEVRYQSAESAGADINEIEQAKKEWQEKGVESKYFKKWFGDSKVVDENGKPIVVYHGTINKFEIFDKNKGGQLDGSYNSKTAFYFTNDKDSANRFADIHKDQKIMGLEKEVHFGKGYNNPENKAKLRQEIFDTENKENEIYSVFLSIKNPLIIDYKEEEYNTKKIDNLIKKAIKNGNDGLIIRDIADEGLISDQYAVFSPEQIKSVNNQGTFDENNPNIYYQSSYSNKTIKKAQEVKSALQKIANGSEEETVKDLRDDLEQYGGTNDVTFIFGDNKKGIQHIAQKHGIKTLLGVFDSVIDGKITKFVKNKKTVHIEKNGIEAVLSLDEHGNKKTWLLTGWNKKTSSVEEEQVSANSNPTQTKPTFSRQDLGAELNNIVTNNERNFNPESKIYYQESANQLGIFRDNPKALEIREKLKQIKGVLYLRKDLYNCLKIRMRVLLFTNLDTGGLILWCNWLRKAKK